MKHDVSYLSKSRPINLSQAQCKNRVEGGRKIGRFLISFLGSRRKIHPFTSTCRASARPMENKGVGEFGSRARRILGKFHFTRIHTADTERITYERALKPRWSLSQISGTRNKVVFMRFNCGIYRLGTVYFLLRSSDGKK